MRSVPVPLPDRPYDVLVGEGVTDGLAGRLGKELSSSLASSGSPARALATSSTSRSAASGSAPPRCVGPPPACRGL